MDTLQVKSFIPGCHVYLDKWENKIDDEHSLEGEPNNSEDKNAVAVVHEKQSAQGSMS